MAADGPYAVEHALVVGGSLVGSSGGVFFQVRRGELSADDIERMKAAAFRHRGRVERGLRYGAMFLTGPSASIPIEAVRAKQRVVVAEMLGDPRIRMAVVVVGESVDSTMLRSASRGVVPSHPQLRVFANPDNACEWLGQELAASPTAIAAALREVRARAARDVPAG
jgi:hypothetical protein